MSAAGESLDDAHASAAAGTDVGRGLRCGRFRVGRLVARADVEGGHNVMHDSLAMLRMIENHDIWRTLLDIADHAGLRIACRADAIANCLCSARIARDKQSARCLRIGQKFASPLREPGRETASL